MINQIVFPLSFTVLYKSLSVRQKLCSKSLIRLYYIYRVLFLIADSVQKASSLALD